MSLRGGGCSAPPFDGLNLGSAVGDEPSSVARNRAQWQAALGARPVWLRQVHGVEVRRLTAGPQAPGPAAAAAPDPQADRPADASWTDARGIACTVLVADCLPVLFAHQAGVAVAAAHAGWRGLSAGVLEATLAAAGEGTGSGPAEWLAWLGPCIGPQAFEVGADVLGAFGESAAASAGVSAPRFVFSPRPGGEPRWRADLAGLAADRLQAAGVRRVATAGGCTFSEPQRYFSYRRDGRCGRHAAAVWRTA